MSSMEETKDKLKGLEAKLKTLAEKLKPEEKRREIRELEAQSLKPGFWDESGAKLKMQRLAELQDEVQIVAKLKQQVSDLLAMVGEEELKSELSQEIIEVEKQVSKLELKLFLSGPHDKAEAILAIHAGQGGTEAMDWAAMLKRMYGRY
ncbi:MAG: PCRF domain-containing protein, partial [Candidatus Chisholmbacteria bacterium]|nr:PCRF domain-containing protein [Candidatus Chisholmbacteria bacterium]